PNNGLASSFPSPASVAVSVPFNTPAAAPTVTVTATGNSGGASFAQNQSLTLNIPPPALSLGTPSPTNVTMVDHSFSAPVTVQITPTNLAGTVTLSCGNLPLGVTCRFSPSDAVNVAGRPTSFVVVFEANGAAQSDVNNITIQANATIDRKSTRLNSSHRTISYAVFCLKKKRRSPEAKTTLSRSRSAPR